MYPNTVLTMFDCTPIDEKISLCLKIGMKETISKTKLKRKKLPSKSKDEHYLNVFG